MSATSPAARRPVAGPSELDAAMQDPPPWPSCPFWSVRGPSSAVGNTSSAVMTVTVGIVGSHGSSQRPEPPASMLPTGTSCTAIAYSPRSASTPRLGRPGPSLALDAGPGRTVAADAISSGSTERRRDRRLPGAKYSRDRRCGDASSTGTTTRRRGRLPHAPRRASRPAARPGQGRPDLVERRRPPTPSTTTDATSCTPLRDRGHARPGQRVADAAQRSAAPVRLIDRPDRRRARPGRRDGRRHQPR